MLTFSEQLAALNLTLSEFPSLTTVDIPDNLYFVSASGGKVIHADSSCGRLARSRWISRWATIEGRPRCTSCFGRTAAREDLERVTALLLLIKLRPAGHYVVAHPDKVDVLKVQTLIRDVQSLHHVPRTGRAADVHADLRNLCDRLTPLVGDVAADVRARAVEEAATRLAVDHLKDLDCLRRVTKLSNMVTIHKMPAAIGCHDPDVENGPDGKLIADAVSFLVRAAHRNAYRLDVRDLPDEITVDREPGQSVEAWLRANWAAAVTDAAEQLQAEWQKRTEQIVADSNQQPDQLVAIWHPDRLNRIAEQTLKEFPPVGSNGVVTLTVLPVAVAQVVKRYTGKASVEVLSELVDRSADMLELLWSVWNPAGSVREDLKTFPDAVKLAEACLTQTGT